MKSFSTSSSLVFNSSAEKFCALAEQYHNLTPQQAVSLAIQAQAGNLSARDQLLLGSLYIVAYLARTNNSCLQTADLYHEGIFGLYKAIESYDPSKGPFHYYAKQKVRYSIEKALAAHGFATKISEETLKRLMKLKRMSSEYEQQNGFPPSADELADLTGYKPQEVESLLAYEAKSIDENLEEAEDEFYNPWAHNLASEEKADSALNRREVAEVLNWLTDKREAYIIRSLYGIDCEQKDVNDLAAEFQLTPQRIRQIRQAAMEKLTTHKTMFSDCLAA